MEKHIHCDKMIIAILQGNDYYDAIQELNDNGFYATVLNSSGGFLHKKSVTLMIGVNHDHLEEAIQILKRYGDRTEMVYKTPIPLSGSETMISYPTMTTPTPLPVRCGGVVLFVLDIERHERY